MKILQYLQENITYQNLWNIVTVVFTGKFQVSNKIILEKQKSKINDRNIIKL